MMFGESSEILFGELEEGKDYIYAYAEGDEFPDGFIEDDVPAMCIEISVDESVWIFEIEN